MPYSSVRPSHNRQAEESSMFLDPNLIKAARRIYRTYCNLHSKMNRKPFGVAIDKDTHRGQLIFRDKPILLPGECFIHINQIEAEIY